MHRGMWCAMALAMVVLPAHAQTTEEYKQLQQRVERLEAQTKARGPAAFNPAISLILQGTARASRDPKTYQITGFVPSGGEVGPPQAQLRPRRDRAHLRGATSIPISAALDRRAHAGERGRGRGGVFPDARARRGFTLKGGRFLSGIGYQNEIHQHAWDFQDAPLPTRRSSAGG